MNDESNIPHIALRIAVLSRALLDATQPKIPPLHRHSARHWIAVDDTGPMSFLKICEALNVDHEKLRTFVQNHKASDAGFFRGSFAVKLAQQFACPEPEYLLTLPRRRGGAS